MSVIGNQKQIYLQIIVRLQPYFRTDANLPERVQKLLAREKRFGSRDRRLYRELIYTTLRYLPWVEPLFERDPDRAAAMVAWLASNSAATANYRSEMALDWPHCPDTLSAKADILNLKPEELLPTWFQEECPAALHPKENDTMHRRASLWIRLQTTKPDLVLAEFDRQDWAWSRSKIKTDAIELTPDASVANSKSYLNGAYEVQDLGSQLVLASTHIKAGEQWLDACAGAGGKTLQLARILGPEGIVTAHDIRPSAIDELLLRADRSGLQNIRTASLPIINKYDGVLVDAPCSGSGTWRRAPHLKWVNGPSKIEDYARLQLELLETYAKAVRSGGKLIYATCSLNHSENASVIAEFLAQYPDFLIEPPENNFGFEPQPWGLTILPSQHNTDGFFVSSMRRK